MRALIIGFFSTVGDVEVLHQVENQLVAAGIAYDVGTYSAKAWRHVTGWIDVRSADPARYTHVCLVCGPFHRPYLVQEGIDLDRFAHCTRIGVNLSMIEPLGHYNPFDSLIGRDSDEWQEPDLSFLEDTRPATLAGVCLVGNQAEYGSRQRHGVADDFLRRLAVRNDLAVVAIDTQWPGRKNTTGLGAPAQVEAVCARLDVMLTTRLHGMVLSLKNGVPVIAIDAIVGAGKVSRQARAVEWPEVFGIESVTDDALDAALVRCLLPVARQTATACAAKARAAHNTFTSRFQEALHTRPLGKRFATSPAPVSPWRKFLRAWRRRV